MMRRLPVYLLLDQSGNREERDSIDQGVKNLLRAFKRDPFALETVYLSVIHFGGSFEVKNPAPIQTIPLTEIACADETYFLNVSVPLGAALKLLVERIEAELVPTTAETKGDWKPTLVLLSSNSPTDDWKNALPAMRKIKWGSITAVKAGKCDESILNEIVKICHIGFVFDGEMSVENMRKTIWEPADPWGSIQESIFQYSPRIDSTDLPPPPPLLTENLNEKSSRNTLPPEPPDKSNPLGL